MMNFEEKTQGWDIIFKGLISPFANRFKKYIQMEINSNLNDRFSDSEISDEEIKEFRKYKRNSKNMRSRKSIKPRLSMLQSRLTLSKFGNLDLITQPDILSKLEK